MSKTIDTDYTDEPTCPHCGETQTNAWEWAKDDGLAECDSCGEPFRYERHEVTRYSTRRVETSGDDEPEDESDD